MMCFLYDSCSNTVSYEYDANGNVIKVTYPDGNWTAVKM
ncbi:MAG: RHS repeat protein [Lachnospira sp.]|nr:RHS repeat protein [Lachnospira sp.]